MDYEKEYKGALNRAKAMIQNNPDHVLYESDIKALFKELQETEDERNERIRQAIKDCIASCAAGYTLLIDDIKVSEVYDWLDKQKTSDIPKSPEAESSYITPHKEFFEFIYDRLVNEYGENPSADYMLSFKERINDLFVKGG